MLRHSFGGAVIFLSLKHFIAPALDLMPCLPSRQKKEATRALKKFVHNNLPQAGFELRSLGLQAGLFPIEPPLLVAI